MAVLCHPPVARLSMQRLTHHEPYLLADSGRAMTEWRAQKRLDDVAQKWRALVDLRLANFADMYRSGRWRHRYTERSEERRVGKECRCERARKEEKKKQ